MATTFDHYQNHLAPIYAWMLGDLDAALARGAAELDAFNFPNRAGGTAVDLGAGIGLHTIPLAQRGYTVAAVDSNQQLLNELQQRSGSLPVTTVVADIVGFTQHLQTPVDIMLCMGDTLTHLPSVASVETLLESVARSLSESGVFVATFRDYTTAPLTGERRFIPVRSDDRRILTCFLEYAEDTVMVHDLLHDWQEGCWQQRVSSYQKLRLEPKWVETRLREHGLSVRRSAGAGGMTCLIAIRT